MTSTFTIRGIPCSSCTIHQFISEIKFLLENRCDQPRVVTFVNAHVINLASGSDSLKDMLESARIVAADGMSIVYTGRLKGHRIAERCNMTEAFRAFLQSDNMPLSRALLIGCQEDDARKAHDKMNGSSRHCKITCFASGYDTIEDYQKIISAHGPFDIILAGMGSPRSEFILHKLSESAPESILWHIGGGTIEFYAGVKKEAPLWMRKSGLQWLHRLIIEPHRMWKRYLIGNSKFIAYAGIDIIKSYFIRLQSK